MSQSNTYNKLDFSRVEHTWFVKLMRVLGPGITKSNIEKLFENVSFIIFNYDRCLEHFLVHALQAVYGFALEEAVEIVKTVPIMHPYGTVGGLSSIPYSGGVPFGGDENRAPDCFGLSEGIKTYTEQIEEHDESLKKIRASVLEAERLVFLGFAYGEQNMALLKPAKPIARRRVYGTALGLSKSDREVVEAKIEGMMKPLPAGTISLHEQVELASVTCAGLFDDYARSLNA